MAKLSFEREHLQAIERHVREAYPEECCGILLGSRAEVSVAQEISGAREVPDAQEVLEVQAVLGAANVSPEDRRHRYAIDPRALLAAHKRARREGREVVGYYHSHPDRPARPSPTDRASAWPGVSYLIVSTAGPETVEFRSFRSHRAEGDLEEEAWLLR